MRRHLHQQQRPVTALTHLLVLVEGGAVAFCHYENPWFHAPGDPRWMSPDLLKAIVGHARRRRIAITFLLGKTRPPPALERLMDRVDHAKIVPAALAEIYRGAVVVLDSEHLRDLAPDPTRSLILRLARRDIGRCAALCEALTGRYGRLSIHLRGIEYFTEADLAAYAGQLKALSARLRSLYAEGHRVEVNVLSDRMLLQGMRNCDAGVTHVTIAPDGACHICPAFVHDGDPIGRFDPAGLAVERIANLELSQGPLCSRCDAFHCKRCVHLSRLLTEEFNVPSEQQCAIAHLEREATRLLLKDLGPVEPFRRMPRIAELNYRDPLELLSAPPPDCSW
jgi:CXXX repeat peptide maturase